ncbi:MAG: hypothetical protein ACLRIS_01490 [Flavonifractor plautii]
MLDGCPKGPALLMLLRGMNHRCWRRMRSPHRRTLRRWRWRPTAACRCCAAHAGSLEELKARPCTAACWTRGCSGGW